MKSNYCLFISLGISGFSVFVLLGHLFVAYPALRLAVFLLLLTAISLIALGAVPIGLDFALSRDAFNVRQLAGASGGLAIWAGAVVCLAFAFGAMVGG